MLMQRKFETLSVRLAQLALEERQETHRDRRACVGMFPAGHPRVEDDPKGDAARSMRVRAFMVRLLGRGRPPNPAPASGSSGTRRIRFLPLGVAKDSRS